MMRGFSKTLVGAAFAISVAAGGAAFAAPPPGTPVEFATFQPDSARDGQPGGMVFLNNADGPPAGWTGPVLNGSHVGGYLFTTDASLHTAGGTTPVIPHTFGTMDTLFNYHNIGGVPTDAVSAGFTFMATTTKGATCDGDGFCDDGDTVTQGGLNGSFSFIYTGLTPFVVNGHAYSFGANLLSGVFTGAKILGTIGDPNGGFSDADRPLSLQFNNVNFSSDIITFSVPSTDQITLTIGAGAFPVLGTPGDLEGLGLNSYRSAATGIFAANPTPMGPPGGAPEPGTWALMIVGFGGAGSLLRARRKMQLAA